MGVGGRGSEKESEKEVRCDFCNPRNRVKGRRGKADRCKSMIIRRKEGRREQRREREKMVRRKKEKRSGNGIEIWKGGMCE